MNKKFYHTIAREETLVTFGDVHRRNSPFIYQYFLQGMFRAVVEQGGDPELKELFRDRPIVYDSLLHPYMKKPDGSYGSTPTKREAWTRLLEIAKEKDPKVFDLWVYFPSQQNDQTGWGNIGKGNPSLEHRYYDPQQIMKPTEEMLKIRRLIEDVRANPRWVYDFAESIPIEENYLHGGPEQLPPLG